MEDNTMKCEIDLGNNAVYIVINGDLTILDEMLHGTDTIHWNKGAVDVVRSQRIRCDGGKKVSGTLVKQEV
ncbi:DUF3954 domain-containing protein [Planomicrobium chinense]|uniref:DUF3954 domain-containing protein n=1 Tax=Planococcus chinensis TaxID=272917 RepID=UPI001CC3EE96|nr:DUF3954 domain-containing protein [Planococcus chinensis]MBZ5203213.1 DUF3954 domain-containing protein [Planococcus chinensis]